LLKKLPVDGKKGMTYDNNMIGFLVKKTFFDLWDNLFRAALVNVGFMVSLAIPVFVPGLFQFSPVLGGISFVAGILWCFIYLAAAALSLRAVSDYGSFGFGDFFRNLKAGWPAGLLLGILALGLWALVTLVIPFYLAMNSLIGLLLAALIFWTLAVSCLALQFFLPIRARLDTKFAKILKKCFIIFFDNPGFCIFSFFYNLLALGISIFLALLFPGPAGILLYLDEAFRLRLLKYDWLEANPAEGAAKRRRIPWDELLIEDRERTGTRSLRNFIFPWKD
jgi:hypothetical protein